MDDKSLLATAIAIQNYLSSRPDAADTVEGIHQWWIQWPGIPEPIAVTMAALEHLETIGFLERLQTGNRQFWRRRRDAGPDPACLQKG